jgi:hypothetical protein
VVWALLLGWVGLTVVRSCESGGRPGGGWPVGPAGSTPERKLWPGPGFDRGRVTTTMGWGPHARGSRILGSVWFEVVKV